MPYTILKADLKKNKEDILSLWKRNFPDLPEERYQWIYENNPAGPASCWLIKENRQNKIVGATSLFPRRILLNGKQVTAGIAGDFAIDKEHRSLGPALLLQKAALPKGSEIPFDFLYGFPNKISEPVLVKAGYKILGEVHSLTKPLKSYYYLKRHANLPVITKPLSFLADLGLKISSKERYSKNSEYEFEALTSFDQRFDTFWDSVSAQFPMIGERTCSYLNWRYIQSTHKNYQVLALIRKSNRDIFGYIVYNIVDNKAHIADLLSLNINEVLYSLFSGFLLYQRTRGIDAVTISFAGAHALMKKLKQYGFSVRTSSGKVIKYSAFGSADLLDVLDKSQWYLLPGDNDI
jgi:hypothetical protein